MIMLPKLPYGNDALEPHISSKTMDFHYGKHHNTYVENLNKLIEGTEFSQETLENIIKNTSGRDDKTAVFNNAAQVWNHTFYWNSIKPAGGGIPYGPLGEKINLDFGSYEIFAKKFKDTALGQFGSGWAWLVQKDGKLEIIKTSNADTPIAKDVKPLLTVDVWEHAYYLDYQNKRADYLDSFIKNLINWDFVNANLIA
ncbi:MAG: superoxide dismutase [Synergistaceae bacterium]|nr:MAG: superoxide dismutase [Fe] [Synergistetes bacterium HGW-Synergistetes-1]